MEVGVVSDLDLLWQLQKQDKTLIDLNERLDFWNEETKLKKLKKNYEKNGI